MILMPPVAAVWVHTHAFTAALPGRNTEWGEANRPRVAEALEFFDSSLAQTEYLAGASFTAADILLLTTVDFAKFIGLETSDGLENLSAWHRRVSARESAKA
jgi:glutathione S-transferase